MKITQMNDEDIVNLTDENLDLLIKAECMEQGIPIEPKPPESTFFEIPKTVTGFNVKGCDFWFEKREHAESVAALLNSLVQEMRMKEYQWQTGYDIEWLKNYESEISIEQKFFYDKLQIQEKEQMLVKRKTLKEQYESDKKKYETSREKVRKISDQIYSLFYEARKNMERLTRYQSIFSEYVKLSEGDNKKARVFFDKAYREEIEDTTYQKLFPPQEAAQEIVQQ